MFNDNRNFPENDPLKGKFDGIDKGVRAPADLKQAAKTGVPLRKNGAVSTAVHVKRFGKAIAVYALGIMLFLGVVAILPGLWESDPIDSPGMNVTTTDALTDGTDFAVLSEAFKAEIEQAYAEALNFREFPGWHEEGEGGVYYYGIYNGCVILYEKGMTNGYDYKKVGEELFAHTEGFNIFAYRDGQIIDLSEAYEDGWVDDAAISMIAEQHKLMLEDYFGERYNVIYAEMIEAYNEMMSDMIEAN